MSQDPYKYFRVEARELLDQLGKGLLELEKSGSTPDLVQALLRYAHTLKGAARVVKQREIGEGAHAFEDVLAPLREATMPVPQVTIDSLLGLVDRMNEQLRGLTPAPAESAGQRRPVADDGFRTVRADVTEMDELLDGIAETHTQLAALGKVAVLLERSRHLADLLTDQLGSPTLREGARPSAPAAENVRAMADEIHSNLAVLERAVTRGIDQARRELVQVRDAAEQLRLVPVRGLFTTLARAARDAARDLGKEVELVTTGGDVRLDAHVLEALQGAMVQLVRNAVAHGIERGADRQALGKPATGRIAIDVIRRGRRVVFRCRDDGRGIDLDAVRRAATSRGLPPAEVGALALNELMQLLLRGGISTAAVVTEVSGRGVGLDVVREATERLGATVHVASERGVGSSFELSVPLSLASLDCLTVTSSGIVATIPLDAVRRTLRIGPRDVSLGQHGETVVCDGRAVPFLQLERLFRLETARDGRSRAWSAVVVDAGAGAMALGVERLLGTATVVLRPAPEYAQAEISVAGVSLDADGNPQIVLDPDGLVERARRQDAVAAAPAEVELPILVIDDSLTTRMLEQSILESAGYVVDTAVSAEAGLECARRKKYALILVDVEMPGMDGFSFIERIRKDPELRHVPAILVTSRAAPEDLQRGRDVGAQGYMVKSEFDQARLLARIRQLLE